MFLFVRARGEDFMKINNVLKYFFCIIHMFIFKNLFCVKKAFIFAVAHTINSSAWSSKDRNIYVCLIVTDK